jgi:hypothetical protein
MGIVLALVFVCSLGWVLHSLRVRGCGGFLLWVLLGMAAMWFALEFGFGGLRI